MIDDEKILQILNNQQNFSEETVNILLNEALKAGGKDNITVGFLVLGDDLKNENKVLSFLQKIQKILD